MAIRNNLPEIPSEYLEMYVQTFMAQKIEAIGFGLVAPEVVKQEFKVINQFVSMFGGIHSRLAVSNEVDNFCRQTNEQILRICKKLINDPDLYERLS